MSVKHLLYGNLPGEDDARGFRVLLRQGWSDVGARERARLEAAETWVRELQPALDGTASDTQAGSHEAGYAAAGLRLDGRLHSCLARVDGRFGRDAFGRPEGRLVHLLACEVDEEHDSRLHVASLAALALAVEGLAAEELAADELADEEPAGVGADSFARYRARLDRLPRVEWASPNLQALRVLGPQLLEPFLTAVARVLGGPTLDVPAPDGPPSAATPVELRLPATLPRRVPEVLAALTGALPPRLRLAVRWGWNLQPCKSVNLTVTTLSPGSGAETQSPGSGAEAPPAYARVLWHRLRAGDDEAVRVVVENWQVRSWNQLSALAEA